ncbi:AAA family ATPase [Paremcibacter congregatus]|uniref:MobA/MobL protein domain-containing protein n=1 Tax=Paremcibacter congregatus TaxID=2043170 RepID=A0A2G4YWQ2_9PROT|nr:AAA family ATPase [Paremcibacter congregatus]PHZ86761.1 hypothetical protein CRD36_00055 [Paremcibacter congregatus]QDE28961.1 hypothetical protein FIV45_17590 [Paremcibacter congregatus]
MAIQFARMRILSRSTGANVVRSAAYNARSQGQSELTGERFYFANRDGSEHHAVLLPEGAPAEMADFRVLWNEAQAAEKRINSQEAKELLLALPSNPEITAGHRLEMARAFVQENFVDHGLAAQLDIHHPHQGAENYHAHVLLTTRRVGPAGMGAKARDLNGQFAKGTMMDGERWGEVWRDFQNDYFVRHHLDVRVDEISLLPGEHIGPERLRSAGDVLALKRNEERGKLARDLMAEPERVLNHLTRQRSSFSVRDLNRYIDQYDFDEATATRIFEAVIRCDQTLYTMDRNGEIADRFTTVAVWAEETEALTLSRALLAEQDPMIPKARAEMLADNSGLSGEQTAALQAGLTGSRLTVIRGRAGTGKSYCLKVLRQGLIESHHDVIGLGPTNMVASALRKEGFDHSSTVHAFLFREKLGRLTLQEGTRLVVDEAAMLDSGTLKGLLDVAYRHRAGVILVGDDGQLSAIERGGLFRDIAVVANAVEISQVRRQTESWSRDATEALSRGDVAAALKAYDDRGFIIRSAGDETAKAALIDKWQSDFDRDPEASRFVFAYRNKDVSDFNMAMRAHLQKRGLVGDKNHSFVTKHGRFDFAAGDRIVMTGTDKQAGLINGQAARITRIEGQRLTLDLEGQTQMLDAGRFRDFRHGYAGTIYKGQGRTVDQAYIYHTKHWGRTNAYVALSRHRQAVHMFVAGDYGDPERLIKSLSREDHKLTSLALTLADHNSPGKAFEMSATGLNDTFDETVADLRGYRRLDPCRAALAHLQADIAAGEITRHPEAQALSRARGSHHDVRKHVSLARRSLRDLSTAQRYLTRAGKMLLR